MSAPSRSGICTRPVVAAARPPPASTPTIASALRGTRRGRRWPARWPDAGSCRLREVALAEDGGHGHRRRLRALGRHDPSPAGCERVLVLPARDGPRSGRARRGRSGRAARWRSSDRRAPRRARGRRGRRRPRARRRCRRSRHPGSGSCCRPGRRSRPARRPTSDGGAPKACSIAHRTAASNVHQARAPSSRGSAERTSDDRVAHARAEDGGGVGRAHRREAAGDGGAVGGARRERAERQRGDDDQRGAGGRERAQRDGPVVVRPAPSASSAAGDGDRRSGRPRRGATRKANSVRVAPRVPRPVRRSAHSVSAAPPTPAVGSRRVAAAPPSVTCVLSRRPEPRGRAAADEPEERDVAGEGEELEDGAADDPARVGVERAAQRVSEGVQRPAGHDDRDRGRGRQSGGHGGPPRERAHVDARDGEFGVGLAEGGHQDYCRAARPSVSLGLLTCRSPERMHAGPDTTTRSIRPVAGPHSGAIHRPGVR